MVLKRRKVLSNPQNLTQKNGSSERAIGNIERDKNRYF